MIPVFEPQIGQEEIDGVLDAMRRGEISGSFGRAIPDFEAAFASYVGAKHGVAVSSGTTALQLAVAAADIGPGDEVLISSCTNIATALPRKPIIATERSVESVSPNNRRKGAAST